MTLNCHQFVNTLSLVSFFSSVESSMSVLQGAVQIGFTLLYDADIVKLKTGVVLISIAGKAYLYLHVLLVRSIMLLFICCHFVL